MTPAIDWTPVDNSIRRNDFKLTEPSVKRAKMRFLKHNDYDKFEEEVESALEKREVCTVCGKNSKAGDGRCEEHINTKLSGDWPESTDWYDRRMSKLRKKIQNMR